MKEKLLKLTTATMTVMVVAVSTAVMRFLFPIRPINLLSILNYFKTMQQFIHFILLRFWALPNQFSIDSHRFYLAISLSPTDTIETYNKTAATIDQTLISFATVNNIRFSSQLKQDNEVVLHSNYISKSAKELRSRDAESMAIYISVSVFFACFFFVRDVN